MSGRCRQTPNMRLSRCTCHIVCPGSNGGGPDHGTALARSGFVRREAARRFTWTRPKPEKRMARSRIEPVRHGAILQPGNVAPPELSGPGRGPRRADPKARRPQSCAGGCCVTSPQRTPYDICHPNRTSSSARALCRTVSTTLPTLICRESIATRPQSGLPGDNPHRREVTQVLRAILNLSHSSFRVSETAVRHWIPRHRSARNFFDSTTSTRISTVRFAGTTMYRP